jgi:hypothetical protein
MELVSSLVTFGTSKVSFNRPQVLDVDLKQEHVSVR